jgi:hypothetical protein
MVGATPVPHAVCPNDDHDISEAHREYDVDTAHLPDSLSDPVALTDGERRDAREE